MRDDRNRFMLEQAISVRAWGRSAPLFPGARPPQGAGRPFHGTGPQAPIAPSRISDDQLATANRRSRARAGGGSAGFTVIELLVAIGIISMLMALLLPAVQQARESGRRNTCASNVRNLAVALLAATEADRRFPASGYYHANSTSKTYRAPNWVCTILPRLERSDISAEWNRTADGADPSNQRLANIRIAVLCCPDDPSLTGGGDLSYQVNGGIGFTAKIGGVDDCPLAPTNGKIDLNGNGVTCPPLRSTKDGGPDDRSLLTMMGLCFMESGGPTGTTRYQTPDGVYDGLSQTFLLAENVRAGVDPLTQYTNWANTDPHRTSFYMSPSVCKSLRCSKGNVDYALANNINLSLTMHEGTPYPSSFHAADGVNMVFADGHLKFISRSIDGAVYAALFTPQGQRLIDTELRQVLLDDARVK
jgi:prepilin-type N-terminal cleavage/methylation domain-containing protein/prepilin-type processing-associated H-X9-DG protein